MVNKGYGALFSGGDPESYGRGICVFHAEQGDDATDDVTVHDRADGKGNESRGYEEEVTGCSQDPGLGRGTVPRRTIPGSRDDRIRNQAPIPSCRYRPGGGFLQGEQNYIKPLVWMLV
jgi:hypothetical protein